MDAAIITLCVAIATFILQEGITNIIHGVIFRLFSHIKEGDRIEVTVDGVSYTGILKKVTIRHVVINDIMTNAEIVIPNSKIDHAIIRNSYNGKSEHNKYVVELPVSYKDAENKHISDIIKMEIISVINDCEYTINNKTNIFINYKESYVGYSFVVITKTVEDNFKACSLIKETLMQNLASKHIHIPFNILDVNINRYDT